MMAFIPLLILPACALIAVLLLAIFLRGDMQTTDEGLHRSFMLIFSMAFLLCYGLLQRPGVQRWLDPNLQKAHELETYPVYQAVQTYQADEQHRLARLLTKELANGNNVRIAFTRARPVLEEIGLSRLGFADESTHVAWGRVQLQTLEQLAQRDPTLCFARINGDENGLTALRSGLSDDNTTAFEQAFVALLRTADAGMGGKWTPPSEKLELGAIQRRYSELREPLVARFGEAAINYLERRGFEQVSAAGIETTVCDARIAQLKAALNERPAMAARLIDSLLR
jgi:hypothetical protein